MARVTTSLKDWAAERSIMDHQRQSVGFVPTMGALHAGHRSLLERARAENDAVVLSIFVNPAQFNDPGDLERYPRTLEEDLALAGTLVDHVLVPDPRDMYPDGYQYRVSEHGLSATLEGAHRPGHFDGVLTVVLKLLNLVRPDRAYFGEKDRQQLELVQGMVRAFHLGVAIVPCPTVRDPDGLAQSSRNRRLSPRPGPWPRNSRGSCARRATPARRPGPWREPDLASTTSRTATAYGWAPSASRTSG